MDGQSSFRSKFKMDMLNVLDKDVAYQLNTYRNWGEVDLMIEPFPKDEKNDGDPIPAKGTKAIFNNVHGIYYGDILRHKNNMPLIDTVESREHTRNESDCSIRSLIQNSGKGRMGRAVYNYSDFMYCKELGRVSNNYLVTLRRFPFPCGDTILFVNPDDPIETNDEDGLQMHSPDIGRMVTWMGVSGNEMGNILKYNFKMPFREVDSEVQEYDGAGDDKSSGPLGALLNGTTKEYRHYMLSGMGGDHAASYVGGLLEGRHPKLGAFIGSNGGGAPYSNAQWRSFRDKNKVYGNVDTIRKTTLRGYDGLDFNQSITLTFDYEIRSYDGINTKAAFLDLLANILAVTYTTGTFWGGGYRMTSGSPQSNVFANLPILKMIENRQINTIGDLYDGITDSLSSIWGQLSQGEGLIGAIKTLGSSLLSMFSGAALNKLGRPTKIALNSLLEPVPTGMWHLTIGNPMHPIMVIGNLILDNTEIEHYGPLGLDDFPTGLKVTCTLHHGKPRDTSLIENMYVLGHSRVYIPMGEYIEDMYDKASELHQSKKELAGRNSAGKRWINYNGKDLDDDVNRVVRSANYAIQNPDAVVDNARSWVQNLYFGTKNRILHKNASEEAGRGSQPIDSKNKGTTSPADGNGNVMQR